ncbi:hypothetical protein Tsp_05104 [Trichinella spiralis]|uniref:hypothetical protein n=1 Tax=Trichinella spiralis TaxID=6334 RepID=UPI0001EFEEF7|nr:hypothetical protein Tsp_05104 [Trichinella spiralis]
MNARIHFDLQNVNVACFLTVAYERNVEMFYQTFTKAFFVIKITGSVVFAVSTVLPPELLMPIEGSVRWRCSSTICQTFDRRANESGLYNVDSSWPTEYWVVKKTVASGRMQADRNTQRIYVRLFGYK